MSVCVCDGITGVNVTQRRSAGVTRRNRTLRTSMQRGPALLCSAWHSLAGYIPGMWPVQLEITPVRSVFVHKHTRYTHTQCLKVTYSWRVEYLPPVEAMGRRLHQETPGMSLYTLLFLAVGISRSVPARIGFMFIHQPLVGFAPMTWMIAAFLTNRQSFFSRFFPKLKWKLKQLRYGAHYSHYR